jgi:hypothetical protein
MKGKQRLSASVDSDLLAAATVNDALRLKLEHERRLDALAEFINAYESEHGAISPAEMELAARRARSRAVTVRGARRPSRARRTNA